MAGAPGYRCLIAFAGAIGSGKSTLAEAVAQRLGLPIHGIDDDKRIVGASYPEFDTWVANGVPFPDDFRRQVYDRALTRLAELAKEHSVVIVEETFHRAGLRQAFFESAEALFGRVCLVEVAVSPDVAIAHLAKRAQTQEGHMAGRSMFDAFCAVADPFVDPDLVVENNGDLDPAVERVCRYLGGEGIVMM